MINRFREKKPDRCNRLLDRCSRWAVEGDPLFRNPFRPAGQQRHAPAQWGSAKFKVFSNQTCVPYSRCGLLRDSSFVHGRPRLLLLPTLFCGRRVVMSLFEVTQRFDSVSAATSSTWTRLLKQIQQQPARVSLQYFSVTRYKTKARAGSLFSFFPYYVYFASFATDEMMIHWPHSLKRKER